MVRLSFFLALTCLSSCSFWSSFEPLSISQYSPSGNTLDPSVTPLVWVTFNTDPDHAKAEGAFSLSSDAGTVNGNFAWSGSRMEFQPFEPLLVGPLYTLSVTSAAETTNGNSLALELHHQFRLGPVPGRPTVSALIPADNSTVSDPRTPLIFVFSQSIDKASAINALQVSPSIKLVQSWNADATVWTLTPQTDWPTGQDISVALTASALFNTAHQSMGQDTSGHFRYSPTDAAAPTLVSVSQDDLSPPTNQTIPADSPLEPATLLSSWPINSDVILTFSRPVTKSSVSSALSLPASLSPSILPANTLTSSVFRLHFSQPLPWNQVLGFALTANVMGANGISSVSPYTFWLKTNDPRYQPPSVVSAQWNTTTLSAYDNVGVPSGTANAELHLKVAQGTAADFGLVSFLANFSVTGSGGFSFSPQSVSVSTASSTASQTIYDVDVRLNVTPSTLAAPAPMTIRLASSFADSKGNSMTADYVLVVFTQL